MDVERNVSQISKKWKWIISVVIWYCTFSLGIGVGFIGSSLIELSKKFGTDIPTLSRVFTVLTFSFLIGAIISGIAFNYVNRQIASGLLLLVMGTGTILMPLVPTVPLFFVTAGIVGFGGAGYDTAQIVWIIEMWQAHAPPYIQTQHFSYAIGTVVSPLLVKSFLPPEPNVSDAVPASSSLLTETEIISLKPNISAAKDSLLYTTPKPSEPYSSTLYVPFLIGGIVAIVGGAAILILYCIKKYEKPKAVDSKVTGGGEVNDLGRSKGCNFRKVILILLSAVVLGTYCGMELCTFQFLPTFTHFLDLKLSQQDGALVLSGLASAFTLGRLIGIFIVLKVRPEVLLLGNSILILCGNTLLMCFANTSLPILWGGSLILGLGFSTVFPAFYGFIERHLKVSNVVGAVMIVAGGLVSSLYPIVIGSRIEKNALILMYTNYFSLAMSTAAFLIIYVITRGGGQRPLQHDQQNEKSPRHVEPYGAMSDVQSKKTSL